MRSGAARLGRRCLCQGSFVPIELASSARKYSKVEAQSESAVMPTQDDTAKSSAVQRAKDYAISKGYAVKANSAVVEKAGNYWEVRMEVTRYGFEKSARIMVSVQTGEVVGWETKDVSPEGEVVSIEKTQAPSMNLSESESSPFWWVLPLLFGLLGGIIGYVALRDEDADRGTHILIFGIIWSVVLYFVYYQIFLSLV